MVFKIINIIPSFRCQLKCLHCVNSSSPQKPKPYKEEFVYLIDVLNKYKIPEIIFTGGEPLLHVEIINFIINNLNYLPKVQITTNGIFATNSEVTKELLSSILQLDHVQLSMDKYHGNLGSRSIEYISEYCSKYSKRFNISFCIDNPLQLVEARKIKNEYSVDVIFERVTNSGRARENNIAFTSPIFAKEILNSKCPNLDTISYIHGKGFSSCCSNIILNHNKFEHCNKNFEQYLESKFFSLLRDNTFQDLIDKYSLDIDFQTSDSLHCNLCEKIFQSINNI